MGLDENITAIYKDTNNEIRQLLRDSVIDSQKQAYKNNLVSAIVITILCIALCYTSRLNYKNNENWKELFNSYDYAVYEVEQDGEGINAFNTGEMGDIINGTESSR